MISSSQQAEMRKDSCKFLYLEKNKIRRAIRRNSITKFNLLKQNTHQCAYPSMGRSPSPLNTCNDDKGGSSLSEGENKKVHHVKIFTPHDRMQRWNSVTRSSFTLQESLGKMKIGNQHEKNNFTEDF